MNKKKLYSKPLILNKEEIVPDQSIAKCKDVITSLAGYTFGNPENVWLETTDETMATYNRWANSETRFSTYDAAKAACDAYNQKNGTSLNVIKVYTVLSWEIGTEYLFDNVNSNGKHGTIGDEDVLGDYMVDGRILNATSDISYTVYPFLS